MAVRLRPPTIPPKPASAPLASTPSTSSTSTSTSSTSSTSTSSTSSMAPLPTGAAARPLGLQGPVSGATTGAHAALSVALAATLDEREHAARFAAIAQTWHEPLDAATSAAFAGLDALRDRVAAARAVATPAGLAAAAVVAKEVERRSYGASKTLSSDWKEGKDVGRAHAQATAAHIAALAASGTPLGEAAIADINRRVRPDSKENAVYRAPGVSKETEFLKRCVPPAHLAEAMRGAVDFLVAAEAQGMHPIERAGRAYHALVNNHAFSDGNGRTSRAVMDWILQAAGFPPVALDDPKVLSFDTATGTTTPGMPQKAVREVVAALTRQLTDTLAALTTPTPTPTTTTTTTTTTAPTATTVPRGSLKAGALAFTNRDYRFVDVPAAFAGHTIEAHAGGETGPRQWTATEDGPLLVAVAPSQHAATVASMAAAGFHRTKHQFRYTDKHKTVVEVWRKDVHAGDVVELPALGWAGARRIFAAP